MNKFTYREVDYDRDVTEIVQLLQMSLSGEHTEESFLWKHYYNPFGQSYGLIAIEEGKVIAVRMFMRWHFGKGSKQRKALRPVDSATHPDYRRLGIFTDLTIRALENCQDYDFIFNTPNEKSLSADKKLGWKEHDDNIIYKLAIVLPVGSDKGQIEDNSVDDIQEISCNHSPYWSTLSSPDYIYWRYANLDYSVACFTLKNEQVVMIYRITTRKKLRVIILFEIIGIRSLHTAAIKKLLRFKKIFLIYFLDNRSTNLSLILKIKRGSSYVVFKEHTLETVKNICLSAADLESVI